MLETRIVKEDIRYETVPCDLCGSDDLYLWDHARFNRLDRCRQCGLVFTNPRIANSTDKNRLLYDRGYFQQISRMTPKLIAARKKSYQLEITELQRRKPKGGRILDVGCGTGLFLQCLPELWDKHGCDVSTYALDEAGKRGIQTYHGEFESLDFGEQTFDVVYFRASLHHAYSPSKCLEKTRNILRPWGLLVIAMSNNYDGLCGRLFKAHIRSYEQAHNYLFSTRTLKRYLLQSKFSVARTRYPYLGTNYGSIRDFFELPILYAKYLYLNITQQLNRPGTYDFASPPFFGNYINIYAILED